MKGDNPMKHIRIILAVLLITVMMTAVMSFSALAADTDYQIIIDNAVKGETYTAYKIFDVKYANAVSPTPTVSPETNIPGEADGSHAHTAYAYTINSSTNAWWSVVTSENGTSQVPETVAVGTYFTANGLKFTKNTVENEWNVEAVTGTNGFNAAAFAVLLNSSKSGKTSAASVTASDTTFVSGSTTPHPDEGPTYYTTGKIILNVGNSGAGYYFVDTTVGALCSLDTTENIATIREKNNLPTQDKSVSNAADGTYGDSVSASIGDTVYFKIEVTDGTGTDTTITVHDKMSAGLTLNANSFTVQTNTGEGDAQETVAAADYTVKTSGLTDDCTFEVELKAAFIAGLGDGKVITVKYSATLNENAVVALEGNPNTSRIQYSNQFTPEDTAKVYTYSGAIYKVDSATAKELAGATFAVTIESGEGDTQTSTPVKLTQVNAGSATAPAVYRCDPGATGDNSNIIVTPESGAVVLLGFKDGTVLTLTETAAPDGYNMLSAPVTVTISAQNVNTVDKTATTTGGASATFVATTYKTVNEETVVDKLGDDAGYQINPASINIIENKSGTELPSTGGIGTVIFYVVGGLLILSAAIVLVLKKRSGRDS